MSKACCRCSLRQSERRNQKIPKSQEEKKGGKVESSGKRVGFLAELGVCIGRNQSSSLGFLEGVDIMIIYISNRLDFLYPWWLKP